MDNIKYVLLLSFLLKVLFVASTIPELPKAPTTKLKRHKTFPPLVIINHN